MTYHFPLINIEQAHSRMVLAWRWLKPQLEAGLRFDLSITPERRTPEQNAKFHAICEDLEKSGMEFSGKPRDAAAWKVLLVSGHAVATKEGAEIVQGIEGELVNLRESTALMSKSRGSSLIEYSLAFCASRGIDTGEPPT
jgi:hypothetical protein